MAQCGIAAQHRGTSAVGDAGHQAPQWPDYWTRGRSGNTCNACRTGGRDDSESMTRWNRFHSTRVARMHALRSGGPSRRATIVSVGQCTCAIPAPHELPVPVMPLTVTRRRASYVASGDRNTRVIWSGVPAIDSQRVPLVPSKYVWGGTLRMIVQPLVGARRWIPSRNRRAESGSATRSIGSLNNTTRPHATACTV